MSHTFGKMCNSSVAYLKKKKKGTVSHHFLRGKSSACVLDSSPIPLCSLQIFPPSVWLVFPNARIVHFDKV